MKKSWLIICLINFFIAAVMGVILRLFQITPLNFNYIFVTHGHSHTALLGWIYLMLYLLIIHHFLPKEKREQPYYSRLFWITQISVFGMMVSFPLQGYALFSIIFSTLHIFCSYFFCYKIWKDHQPRSSYDGNVLKTALLFMLLSTIGVWCLGLAGATGTKNSAFYQSAIQFFLHFQFNGWFLFAVLALLINQFQKYSIAIDQKKFNWFIGLLILATVLTLGLPLSWYYPYPLFYWSNGIGLLLQLIAIGMIGFHFKRSYIPVIKNRSAISRLLIVSGLISLFLKITIQSVTLWPEMAAASHYIRNFTIGFIHLIMLGIINSFLFFFTTEISVIRFLTNKTGKSGLITFIIGFLATELILFIQGMQFYLGKGMIPNYFLSLFIVSLLLPLGLLLIIFGTIFTKK